MFKTDVQLKTETLEPPQSVFADVFKYKQDNLKPKLSVRPTFVGCMPNGVTFKLIIPIK